MKKGKNRMAMLLILVVGISIGYAALATNLKINGTSVVKGSNWNIYWDNVNVDSGSVTGSNVVTAPSTTGTTTTEVEFAVVLPEPGDYYEFTVDAVNAGSIDAMIDNNGVLNKVYTDSTYTEEATLPKVLKYTVTYADGRAIEEKHLLAKKDGNTPTIEKYKVRVEYRNDEEINPSDLDKDNDRTYYFKFAVTYVQADDTARKVRMPAHFASSSWDDIISSYKAGDIEYLTQDMINGVEREIDVGAYGKHKVRIANLSTPDECKSDNFSQSACGLVLEFSDIITDYYMKTTNTNSGAWKESKMREFVNGEIYNSIEEALRSKIVITTVVSGHGPTAGEINEKTEDSLFLLAKKEVLNDTWHDTLVEETRQLDYYQKKNTSLSNGTPAKKLYNSLNHWWWLRSAYSTIDNSFFFIDANNGTSSNLNSSSSSGVSPAFKICK